MIKENNLVSVPSANITVNKSRIKLYKNTGDMPTYYLQKGQEFQLELFNPTQDVIMAKIYLNDKVISQGGLIIRQGERIFLERYLDVAKKFLFDTYEVSSSEEVKKAIEKNGDFKVEFFKELKSFTKENYFQFNKSNPYSTDITLSNNLSAGIHPNSNTSGNYFPNNLTFTSGVSSESFRYKYNGITTNSNFNTTSFNSNNSRTFSNPLPKSNVLRSLTKIAKIETGKVEEGSESEQKLKIVSMDFDFIAFHTIECKMLPISQKINTVEDIKKIKPTMSDIITIVNENPNDMILGEKIRSYFLTSLINKSKDKL